ncbi:hypothetical protein NPIL_520591 [Nephila pilipes]|uniref:Uncharacterized protein n=1 Tax=Nephila pilipes TaxID=299642 RepID=A0A8X6T6Y5_NEPPI|nr:hypothetical protein NPIL_520591 [Nephila pilipes]
MLKERKPHPFEIAFPSEHLESSQSFDIKVEHKARRPNFSLRMASAFASVRVVVSLLAPLNVHHSSPHNGLDIPFHFRKGRMRPSGTHPSTHSSVNYFCCRFRRRCRDDN